MRIVAVYEKSERVRHIGHLDLMRFMQRALRRSGLPVAYSKGFNPHVLVSFASALSVGAVGLREVMDADMAEDVTPERFVEVMRRTLPPELYIREAYAVDDHHPAAMALVKAARYDLLIPEEAAAERLTAACGTILEKETIPAVRKTKSGLKDVDIKPLIYALRAENGHIDCTLALTEQQSCKPDMLLTALCAEAGIDPEAKPAMRVTREALLGTDEAGTLVPVETL